MNKSSISPAILQDLFDSARNAADKGQAQWFTPLDWGKVLALPLPMFRPAVVDLTCGNGQLLRAAGHRNSQLLGCDIENTQHATRNTQQHFLQADVTRFYDLLREIKWQADLFVLNPPWDLHWYREPLKGLGESDCVAVLEAFAAHDGRTSKDTIDSTIASLCIAIDRCSQYGEGFQVANEATLQRLLFKPGAPHAALAQHVWAHVVIDGNICQSNQPAETDFQTGVIYFSRGHQIGIRSGDTRHVRNLQEAEAVARFLHHNRLVLRRGAQAEDYGHTKDTVSFWDAAGEEWRDRYTKREKPKYNIWLEVPPSVNQLSRGIIRTHLSLFDTQSGRVPTAEAAALNLLNGRQPIQLVVQRSQRKALEAAVAPGSPWTVDPMLPRAIAVAIQEYNAVRAPLYPLPKIQRLGYLDEQDSIECTKRLGDFFPGHRYPIRSITVAVKRKGTRMNLEGGMDQVEWNGQELAFFIRDASGIERVFMEARLRDLSTGAVTSTVEINLLRPNPRGEDKKPVAGEPVTIDFTLQELCSHFNIPEVDDVAKVFPEDYQRHLATLEEIERLVA